jgi:hypothetical protein
MNGKLSPKSALTFIGAVWKCNGSLCYFLLGLYGNATVLSVICDTLTEVAV